MFAKTSVGALFSTFSQIGTTVYTGASYLFSSDVQNQLKNTEALERDNFEDDLDSLSKDISHVNSPLATIDTQNKIWLKIITREKVTFDDKKRKMRKVQAETEATATRHEQREQLS